MTPWVRPNSPMGQCPRSARQRMRLAFSAAAIPAACSDEEIHGTRMPRPVGAVAARPGAQRRSRFHMPAPGELRQKPRSGSEGSGVGACS